jgi:SAM-dependent methyltransferase
MDVEKAIARLRADPSAQELVTYAYYDADARTAASRFAESEEFAEVLQWTGSVHDKTVLDAGAGRGIATMAFLRAGARRVHAVEPGCGSLVGRGAIESLDLGERVTVHAAGAESLPVADGSVDVIYARQVLHHIPDLDRAMREFRRVLAPGGVVFATREHVAETERERQAFLRRHPVHVLAGGENALPLGRYIQAFEQAGLHGVTVLGPWDSFINAFPTVTTKAQMSRPAEAVLARRLGPLAVKLLALPGFEALVDLALSWPRPGRLHSFFWRQVL